MEEALLEYDSAGSTKERAVAAAALAEAVREHLDGEPPVRRPSHSYFSGLHAGKGLFDVGLYIYNEKYPVTIDEITYPTAMNAFQAMKASPADRSKYTTCNWSQATHLGRFEKIDVETWDDNRDTLMHSILVTQAGQHSKFKKRVMKYGSKGYHENSMTDAFWPTALPGIWSKVRETLGEKGEEEEGEEEEGEEEEGEEEEGEEESEEDDDAAEAAEMVKGAKRGRSVATALAKPALAKRKK